MLEAEYLTSLWIDPRHDMSDGAILPRCVHGLEDQQDSITIRRIEKLLLCAQARNMLAEQRLILLLRFVDGVN
jgi:hypothetical protein